MERIGSCRGRGQKLRVVDIAVGPFLYRLRTEREGFTGGGLSTLADYGAIFFSDCLAGGSGFEVNLSSAGPVNMVDGSATVSTALEVSATVLECHYGTNQP